MLGLEDDDEADEPEAVNRVPGPLIALFQKQQVSIAATAATAAAAVATDIVGGGDDSFTTPNRRHSTCIVANPASSVRVGATSPVGRLPGLSSEDEEFMVRLQQNRSSWRVRPQAGSHGLVSMSGVGVSGSCEGGLQKQTHAVLEQLKGELRSLSIRSIHAASSTVALVTSAGPAAGGCGGGGGGCAAPGSVTAAGHGTVDNDTCGSRCGGGDGCSPLNARSARLSDGYAHSSPSRFAVSAQGRCSSTSGGGGSAGGGGGVTPLLNTFTPLHATFDNGPDTQTHAVAETIRAEQMAVAEAPQPTLGRMEEL